MRTMIEVLMKEYWKRADAFLLPLTKLPRSDKYNPEAFMFWDSYSIENYNLMLVYNHVDEKAIQYFRKEVFPILDSNGLLLESYDIGDKTVFVLDMSEWAMDIEMLLKRKYSKLSKSAKRLIERYHKDDEGMIGIEIYSTIFPAMKQTILDNDNALNYVSKHYAIAMSDLDGEIGSQVNRDLETLKL